MPRRSNEKGNKFERDVCRALTKWITGSEKPELFWRSATSGAKATQDAKGGHKSKMGGDIVSVDAQGLWFTKCFSIECKDRNDYGNLDLVFIGKGDFLKWWNQTLADAGRMNKVPMLVFKRFRGEVLVAFPAWLATGSVYASGVKISDAEPVMIIYGADRFGIAIYQFDVWLQRTMPSRIRTIAKEQEEQRKRSYLASSKPPKPHHLPRAGGNQ